MHARAQTVSQPGVTVSILIAGLWTQHPVAFASEVDIQTLKQTDSCLRPEQLDPNAKLHPQCECVCMFASVVVSRYTNIMQCGH